MLDGMLDGKLLHPVPPETKETRAVEEGSRLKRCMRHLRYLFRATDESRDPLVTELKKLLKRPGPGENGPRSYGKGVDALPEQEAEETEAEAIEAPRKLPDPVEYCEGYQLTYGDPDKSGVAQAMVVQPVEDRVGGVRSCWRARLRWACAM
eukprot:1786308-Alexandrium_andersonii.AAC.1